MSDSRKLTNDPPPSRASENSPERESETIWHLPNQLTVARLVLSVVFFVVLALESHGALDVDRQIILNTAFVLFVCAVITDFLDGYLARRWGLTSTFGRIADPFADKIVICGGFVMLTGIGDLVEPWFAVVIMFREFLVSGLRSFLESKGVAFGAALSGKLKMIVQSITIPVVLLYESNIVSISDGDSPGNLAQFSRNVTVCLLGLTPILTLTSCVGYLQRAYQLIRSNGRDKNS